MKKGYLYLIFIALSSVVVLGIALIFKLNTTTVSTKTDISIKDQDESDLSSLVEVQNYKNSWIQKLAKEKSQKEYLYPVEKFHIEFN